MINIAKTAVRVSLNCGLKSKRRTSISKTAASMVELSVPNDFMCPISLEVMKDPVTLSTGKTYDRRSIERWFETGHNTCPSTMQVIDSNNVAPNRTLQRLIRRWCVCNNDAVAIDFADQQPTPIMPDRPPATATAKGRQMKLLLQQVAVGVDRYNILKQLKVLAMDSAGPQHENRRLMREVGAIPILTRFAFSPENVSNDDLLECCEIALSILTDLPLQNFSNAVKIDAKQLTAISWFLNRGSLDARVNAALVLASICEDDIEVRIVVGATAGVFEGLVQLLKENLYPRASDAALKAVFAISSGVEKNIKRTVEAGVVFAVAELLPEAQRQGKDRPLTKLLELLCSCEEGKKAVSTHALVVPMLVRILNQRDPVGSESAVSCLWFVCSFSPDKCFDEAATQPEILVQLRHIYQCDDRRIKGETKRRAAELYGQLLHRKNLSRSVHRRKRSQ